MRPFGWPCGTSEQTSVTGRALAAAVIEVVCITASSGKLMRRNRVAILGRMNPRNAAHDGHVDSYVCRSGTDVPYELRQQRIFVVSSARNAEPHQQCASIGRSRPSVTLFETLRRSGEVPREASRRWARADVRCTRHRCRSSTRSGAYRRARKALAFSILTWPRPKREPVKCGAREAESVRDGSHPKWEPIVRFRRPIDREIRAPERPPMFPPGKERV